jgi:hypothetical protein
LKYEKISRIKEPPETEAFFIVEEKKGWQVLADRVHPFFATQGASFASFGIGLMIISVSVFLKDIFEQGRDFKWAKPPKCPRCHSIRLWGHGFVAAFFDGFSESVWLRRYRCPDCRCILRIKPKGYFPRFRATIATIRCRIEDRLLKGRWPPGLLKSRQRHWLSALRRKAAAFFGLDSDLIWVFEGLIGLGQVPVSRSFSDNLPK